MKYVLLTDAAPLREGGMGCQVLARDWLTAMGDETCLIVTHRTLLGSDRAQVEQGQTIPLRYYYNLGAFRLGRLPLLRRCLEWLVFLFVLPGIARAVRRSGAQRIFALSGAAPGFLFFALLLARASRLPLDLFLVDDYEEFVQQGSQAYLAAGVRFFERRALRRADRVFAISPGYADHLWTKYGQRAHWLPVLAVGGVPPWKPYDPIVPDVRDLVFVGSVNFLYEECLSDLHRAVVEWNRQPNAYCLRLKLLTRRRPESLLRRLPSTDDLNLVLDADDHAKMKHLRAAWAVFLPYSFAPEARFFVATSFSYKFTDALAAGRPILAYGPPHASLPRYFREENLPLTADSASELLPALGRIVDCDNAQTMSRYADAYERHHSPQALKHVLETAPSTAPSTGMKPPRS